MEIVETQVYRGANVWAPLPAVRFLLDIGELEERPTNTIPGFYDKLTSTLPGLVEHRCSVGRRGGFFERVKEGTWMGHVLEHSALELQTLAGQDVGFGKARSARDAAGNVPMASITSSSNTRRRTSASRRAGWQSACWSTSSGRSATRRSTSGRNSAG